MTAKARLLITFFFRHAYDEGCRRYRAPRRPCLEANGPACTGRTALPLDQLPLDELAGERAGCTLIANSWPRWWRTQRTLQRCACRGSWIADLKVGRR